MAKKSMYCIYRGFNQSGYGISENNIYISRDMTFPNEINFYYWVVDKQPLIAQVSQTDRVMAYIMALTPTNSSAYTLIQVCVYDATTGTWYQPISQTTAVPQLVHRGDVALECTGDYTQHLNNWKVAENFKAYNIYQTQVDLYQYGRVFYLYTPTKTSPYAWNAYYFDPETYLGVPNAQANIFITRYAPGTSYPPHP